MEEFLEVRLRGSSFFEFALDRLVFSWYVQYMNVQNMNKKGRENRDTYKDLLLLVEISNEKNLSQRDLSKRLNIALGLVNSYMKNLISKGYVTIKAIPSKRYAYYLTPKGFAEKSRLTYKHLQNFTNLYKIAKKDFQVLFRRLEKENVKKVVFCGVDEVAEIAYISIQAFEIELIMVVDYEKGKKKFFNYTVRPLEDLKTGACDRVVITSMFRKEELHKKLLAIGVPAENILSQGEI